MNMYQIKDSSIHTHPIPHHLFDQSLHNIEITIATLKYGLVAFSTLILTIFLLIIFVIGAINLTNCAMNKTNTPLYLMLMGFFGVLRLFLFYACPYSYSKSIGYKIYKNVAKKLLIDRFKLSNKASKTFLSLYDSTLSLENCVSRIKSKFLRLFSFIFNFCCCCCCFNLCYFGRKQTSDDYSEDQRVKSNNNKLNTLNRNCSVVFQLDANDSTSSISNTFYNSNYMNKTSSFSNMSSKTSSSVFTNVLNEFFCTSFKCLSFNNKETDSVTKSKSCNSFKPSEFNNAKSNRRKVFKSASFSIPKASYTYSNRNVSRNPSHLNNSYNYGSRKHMRRYCKAQKPHKLIDTRLIRYGSVHLLQRVIDLFMVCWFICGNYWILMALDLNSGQILPTEITRFNTIKNNLLKTFTNFTSSFLNARYLNESLNSTIQQTNLTESALITLLDCKYDKAKSILCFRVAFFQIMATYALFVFVFLFAIVYRFFKKSFTNCIKMKIKNTDINIPLYKIRKRVYSYPDI